VVATPFLKRKQQVLKPRDSPEITDTLKPSLSAKRGQHRRDRQIGEGSLIRPGSWTEAKAQDGPPGNLGDPAHVHVRASRQSGRRLNNDPGPEGTLRPSGSASASCETRTEEGSVDPGSETNKRPGMRAGKS
jgi:hypothetical protein